MTRRVLARILAVLAISIAVGLLAAGPAAAASARSSAFGGYTATPTTTKSVVAQFVVPTVSCPVTGNRGLYVLAGRAGNEGFTDRSAGVFIACQNGAPAYLPVIIGGSDSNLTQPVAPGDHMRVQLTTPGEVKIVLTNLTRGWAVTETGPATPDTRVQVGLSDLTFDGVLAPLPNFGMLKFDSVMVSGQKLSARPHTAVSKTNPSGTVQATPGAIGPAGTGFSIVFKHP